MAEDAEIIAALSDPRTILLDVRRADEHAFNGLKPSLNIPHSQIKEQAARLPEDKDTPIVAYCASGNRVKTALVSLHELGYAKVLNATSIDRITPLFQASQRAQR